MRSRPHADRERRGAPPEDARRDSRLPRGRRSGDHRDGPDVPVGSPVRARRRHHGARRLLPGRGRRGSGRRRVSPPRAAADGGGAGGDRGARPTSGTRCSATSTTSCTSPARRRRRTPMRTSRTSPSTSSATSREWLQRAADEARHRRRAGGDGRARGRDEGAVRRPALHREVSPPLPRVRCSLGDEGRGARVRSRAAGLRARGAPSRSATARTTSSCSSGPATASPSPTHTSARWPSPTMSVPPWTRRASRRSSRLLLVPRPTRADDLRAARCRPGAGCRRLRLARKAPPTRSTPCSTGAAELLARARAERCGRARAATRSAKQKGQADARGDRRSCKRVKDELQLDGVELPREAERQSLRDHVPEPATRERARRRDRGRRPRSATGRRAAGRRGRAASTPRSAASTWSEPRRSPASRFGYWIGDTALLALALYRLRARPADGKGFVPVLPPVLVRESALYRHRLVPVGRPEHLQARGRGSLPRRDRRDPAGRPARRRDPRRRTRCRSATSASPRASARRPARRGRTRAGCSACTSSTRSSSSCSRARRTRGTSTSACSRTPRSSSAELGLPYRVVVLPPATCPRLGEDVRRRDLVPVAGSLPRNGLRLQHDRLPGPAARHSLPGRARPRAGAHAQRHRRASTGWRSRSSRTTRATSRTCSRPSGRPPASGNNHVRRGAGAVERDGLSVGKPMVLHGPPP